MTQPSGINGGDAGKAPEATLISVILDRSGSMRSVCEPTISGFNEFLRTQQRQHDGGGALMSLTQFDDRYEVNFVGEPIENVPELDTRTSRVAGRRSSTPSAAPSTRSRRGRERTAGTTASSCSS